MASTITTSVVTGGTNSHATTSAEANAVATDFIHYGVGGPITLNSGSGGSGSFCVNAQGTPAMFVDVSAGTAWIAATPSGQVSQKLRASMTATYTSYAISSNSSGSTRYDWIYLKVDPTAANNPASDASDVTSLYTSRSTSNSTDTGTPPTYGILLAVVTVANGASSISNSNISDKRTTATFRSSPASSGVNSVDISTNTTGNAPVISAQSSVDTNVPLSLKGKGTGGVEVELRTQTDNSNSINSATTAGIRFEVGWGQVIGNGTAGVTDSVSFPTAFTTVLGAIAGPLAVKATTAATDITGLTTGYTAGTSIGVSAESITVNGMTVNLNRNTGTFASGTFYGYSWIAWGI